MGQDAATLKKLEEEYVYRVDRLDKFERHWMMYIMDTYLWEGYREKKPQDAVEHQRRRVAFHEHYYCRPTFILAWCHEELGDCLLNQAPHRAWQFKQEYTRAYYMLSILCGTNHQ